MTHTKNCLSIMFFVVLYSVICFVCLPQDIKYNDKAIADAIYKAENSKKYPYGIISIDTNGDEVYARKICLNTIRNNRKRYADYGHKKYDTYLEFLSSRYAPVGATNDPTNLNVNWLKNVKWFLEH